VSHFIFQRVYTDRADARKARRYNKPAANARKEGGPGIATAGAHR
jgi:hypothetical protein